MIGYFDASAIVPLLLEEPTTEVCRELWENADPPITSLISYAEASAALGQARRMGRIDDQEHAAAKADLDQKFGDLTTLAVDEGTIRLAGDLAAQHSLRGYDSVHCATATRLWSTSMVAITGDSDLVEAWRDLGGYTIDTVEMSQR